MEIDGGGRGSEDALGLGSSHGNEDSPKSTTINDDDDEWLFSDCSSEEEGDDDGNPVYEIPKASSDHDEQSYLLYENPQTKLHGLKPTRLFPAYKTGDHVFYDDYNLGDTTEVSVSNVAGCLNECQCRCYPMNLLQFVEVKIAGYQPNCPGRAEIYGFIAARDKIERLRNYAYRRENKNCEAVSVKPKTGMARLSLTSPTRVISMSSRAFIEFELHDRNESEAKGNDDDGLIMEGCTELYNMFSSKSFIEHRRLHGERCALDIKYVVLINAVEARVRVEVLRPGSAVAGGVDLKLYAKPSGFREAVRLFRGAAPEEQGSVMSFTLAVERRSGLVLYVEGLPRDESRFGGENEKQPPPCAWWHCGLAASYHRTDEEVAELGEFGAFSIKVTWKSYETRGGGG